MHVYTQYGISVLTKFLKKSVNTYIVSSPGDVYGTQYIRKIELKWQKRWTSSRLFEPKRDSSKRKFFIIFAYPGISGFLH
ncbi:MAG: hypothetical protein J7K59_06030, partial [Candidatus Korarchaeota archaeon]|nr:hypothetical protein [Candidatus Korarchaeota archaeon]